MHITSSDYWAVRNEYLPLMHTWSLGIEEQFYLLYPVIFTFLSGKRKKYILPFILTLSTLSLFIFLLPGSSSAKFYFIQYRFFELAFGGISAIVFRKKALLAEFSKNRYVLYGLLVLLIFLLYSIAIESNTIKVLSTSIITSGVLVLGQSNFQTNTFYKALLSNKIFTEIGKMSYSLYMWHQLVFAFSRYFLVEKMTLFYAVILTLLILLLSIFSYHIIENPFRNRKKIKLNPLLITIGTAFVVVTGAAFYVYSVGGIIKDVPELGITMTNKPTQFNFFNSNDNINIKYNEDVRALNNFFSNEESEADKLKVLVLGNSFGRDMTNILLESSFINKIQVRYSTIRDISNKEIFTENTKNADIIFYCSQYSYLDDPQKMADLDIDLQKSWIVGNKDFGISNGIHYNKKNKDYSNYYTSMKAGVLELNISLKNKWDEKYIDLIELISDEDGKVLVFTPEGKFISQDTEHLTKYGAKFYADLLSPRLSKILGIN